MLEHLGCWSISGSAGAFRGMLEHPGKCWSIWDAARFGVALRCLGTLRCVGDAGGIEGTLRHLGC